MATDSSTRSAVVHADRERDTTRRAALARVLCARICDERRSLDELRVVDWILQGLELGADDYGPLTIATDPRNFVRERAMEARDLLFYTAAQAIAEHDARVEQVEREFEEAIGIKPVDDGGENFR